jgi:hypothetical protein
MAVEPARQRLVISREPLDQPVAFVTWETKAATARKPPRYLDRRSACGLSFQYLLRSAPKSKAIAKVTLTEASWAMVELTVRTSLIPAALPSGIAGELAPSKLFRHYVNLHRGLPEPGSLA